MRKEECDEEFLTNMKTQCANYTWCLYKANFAYYQVAKSSKAQKAYNDRQRNAC